MKKTILLTILILGFGVPAILQAQTRCDVAADVFDGDPDGTNIRGGAGSNFPVVKTITDKHSTVNISASKGAWFKIATVYDRDGNLWKNGWIYAPLLGVYAENGGGAGGGTLETPVKLLDAPNPKGKTLTRIPHGAPLVLQSCRGTWVKVLYESQTGWLASNSYCAFTGSEDECEFDPNAK